MSSFEILDSSIRRVPDFPKSGILFYDITGILVNPEAFDYCIQEMVKRYKDSEINAVAGIESRGFLFAAPLAHELNIPLILIRKKGKLPGNTYSCSYNLEYGQATIEVHKSDIIKGQKILLIDDLIATGGTLNAAKELIKQGGATTSEIFGIVGLPFLNYKQALGDTPVTTLINYDAE